LLLKVVGSNLKKSSSSLKGGVCVMDMNVLAVGAGWELLIDMLMLAGLTSLENKVIVGKLKSFSVALLFFLFFPLCGLLSFCHMREAYDEACQYRISNNSYILLSRIGSY